MKIRLILHVKDAHQIAYHAKIFLNIAWTVNKIFFYRIIYVYRNVWMDTTLH